MQVSRRQAGDKCITLYNQAAQSTQSTQTLVGEHTRNASPETEAKSCDPGRQPFKGARTCKLLWPLSVWGGHGYPGSIYRILTKNPIQINLFREGKEDEQILNRKGREEKEKSGNERFRFGKGYFDTCVHNGGRPKGMT